MGIKKHKGADGRAVMLYWLHAIACMLPNLKRLLRTFPFNTVRVYCIRYTWMTLYTVPPSLPRSLPVTSFQNAFIPKQETLLFTKGSQSIENSQIFLPSATNSVRVSTQCSRRNSRGLKIPPPTGKGVFYPVIYSGVRCHTWGNCHYAGTNVSVHIDR